ncbi:MAG: ABC transporter ATP-binding protein [Planctomycetaceae bacterium]
MTDPRIGLAAAVYVVCVLLEEGVLMTANPAIYSLREAVVHFGDLKRPVLQQISLRIPRGQFLTVVGPSGCGKSTLLRVLAGLQSLSGGELERSAEPASVVSGGGSAAELRAGFVFQQPALLPWRTALQNLRLPLELGAGSPDDERLLGLLEQVGLSRADAGKRPGQLSGGMQMRLSLARALVHDPQVLLLDEPFAAVDDFLRMKLQDSVRSLHDSRGLTTILVTHNLQEAAYLSDRVVVLQPAPRGITADFSVERSRMSPAERRRAPEQFKFLQQLSAALFPS